MIRPQYLENTSVTLCQIVQILVMSKNVGLVLLNQPIHADASMPALVNTSGYCFKVIRIDPDLQVYLYFGSQLTKLVTLAHQLIIPLKVVRAITLRLNHQQAQ